MNLLNLKTTIHLDVDRATAEICLKLVELYIDKSDLDVLRRDHEDGTTTLEFAERAPELARKREEK